MRGSVSSRLVIAVAAVAVVGGALLTVVPPRAGRTVATVSRFGSEVRLLRPGLGLSFLPTSRRVVLPVEDGAAVVTAPVEVPLAGGATLPARVELHLEGSGPLPLDAARVRTEGWKEAWTEVLQPHLGVTPETSTELLATAPLWHEIFPADTTAAPAPPPGDVATLFDGAVTARSVTITPEASPEAVRAAARQRVTAATHARGRFVLLGLDALDWSIVDQLTARGTMPNLARLIARGASAVEDVPQPLISPVVWTTLGTGVPPEVHGVLDFLEPDPDGGPPRPVSAASRTAPTLWDMVAAAGRSSAVIGWWATFPAQAPPGGTVYSDRLTEQLLGLSAAMPSLADPPQAEAVARRLALHADDVTPEMLAPFLTVSRDELDAVLARKDAWDDPIGGLAKLVAATLTVERLTRHELDAGTDVIFSYLEGTDTVGHLFGTFRPPALPIADPAEARRFGDVVDRYYAHVDRWIGRVLGSLGPDDTVVIVSDHGFEWGDGRPRVPSGAHTATAVMWHRPEGFFLAAGPGVRHTPQRQRLGVLDVAPAVLALAGLPPASEMPGSVPTWLGVPARSGAPDVDYAALLPRREAVRVELPPEAREEELAKLRALGYLAGGDQPSAPAAAAPGAPPAPTAAPTPGFDRAEARRLNNLAISRAQADDKAGAEEAFRQAIAADPTYASAYYSLGILLRNQGRLDESDRMIWESVRLGVRQRELVVVQMALDYAQRGDMARAASVLALGRRRLPDSATIWLNSGVMAGTQGEYQASAELLQHAIQLDPANPAAYRNLAAAELALGQREQARATLTRLLEIDPSDTAARQQLDELGGPAR